MVKRLASHQVLQRLKDIESNCSGGELSDSENPLENDAYPSVVQSDEERINELFLKLRVSQGNSSGM